MWFKVRIETWDGRGNNLGWMAVEQDFNDFEAAVEEARKLYKTEHPTLKHKQLSIFNEHGLIWKYHKGKVKTYQPKIRKT